MQMSTDFGHDFEKLQLKYVISTLILLKGKTSVCRFAAIFNILRSLSVALHNK